MSKLRIKSGDTVKVITGKYKGKSGKVLQVFPRLDRVVVEGVAVSKKHLRSRKQDQPGQVVEFSMPIHMSNVMPLDASGKAVRHTKIKRDASAKAVAAPKAAPKKKAAEPKA